MINKNSINKKLILLISIFMVGFFSLYSLNKVFVDLVNKLDNETYNLSAKLTIGEFISSDIIEIRSLFHELATTTSSQRSRDIIINKIKIKINIINNSLNILENGGTLKRDIRLNIAGHLNTVKEVVYKKYNEQELSLEVIDIKPKLLEMIGMLNNVNDLLDSRETYRKNKDSISFAKTSKKIRRYYKVLPSYFTRLSENIRRLLYEGEVDFQTLKTKISEDKLKYMRIKIYLILTIVLIVLIFGYMIIRNVNRESQKMFDLNIHLNETLAKQEKQERSIRAILDAQSNIIIVSNGENMIDANRQLLKFFDKYNSFEEFKKDAQCICDFFEESIPNDEYIIKKDYEGLGWAEYIIKYPEKHFKVIIKKNGIKHHFLIQATKTILDDNTGESVVIITLNDITAEINSQIKLASMNDNLGLIVKKKTKELQELNENLEQKVIIESAKAREKDRQMIQQSRFAALGEMIGNIAHQWRQPLSAINTTASGMQLQMDLGLTDDKDIKQSYSNIMSYVDFLNQTIEDFRGFFREDKEKVDFNIFKSIKETLSITSSTYKDNDIEIIKEFDENHPLISHGMPSELSQVLMNILNNAKDAIISSEVKNKFVRIICEDTDKSNIIYIQDNAGGIPKDIKEKIFDPYFTTKHQSQGTGIGLYMSKDIIEKHMDGKISVKNKNIKIKEQNYTGACFKIELPKVNSIIS